MVNREDTEEEEKLKVLAERFKDYHIHICMHA